jgi:hypothetical protein
LAQIANLRFQNCARGGRDSTVIEIDEAAFNVVGVSNAIPEASVRFSRLRRHVAIIAVQSSGNSDRLCAFEKPAP